MTEEIKVVICQKCGHVIILNVTDIVCPCCGKLPVKVNCPKCGTWVSLEAKK